jgi:hypothetical protein
MDWFWKAIFLLIFTVPVIFLFGYGVWDVVRRPDVGALPKALWLLAFCFVPIVGPLVYLVIRPPGTTAQQIALAQGTTTPTGRPARPRQAHRRGVPAPQGEERRWRVGHRARVGAGAAGRPADVTRGCSSRWWSPLSSR